MAEMRAVLKYREFFPTVELNLGIRNPVILVSKLKFIFHCGALHHRKIQFEFHKMVLEAKVSKMLVKRKPD